MQKHLLRMTTKQTIMKTKLKNLALTIISIFFFSQKSAAQLEIGFGAGTSMYLGDLGGSLNNGAYKIWDLDYQTIRGMGQVFVKMPINKKYKAKVSFAYASIAGNDVYAENPDIYNRGFSMTGKVSQLSGTVDIALSKKHEVYGIVGLGYLLYNPIVYRHGESGQLSGSRFHNSCFSVPLGIGFKIADVGKNAKIAFETVTHYVNSDWVDGIAGPNSYSNDNFIFTTINYSMLIGKKEQNQLKPKQPQSRAILNLNICPEFEE
jgi:hypothetical protein